MIVDLLYSN